MSLSLRQQKAASLWQNILGQVLVDELLFKNTAWSIFTVIPTADLKTARVYISAIGPEADHIIEQLNQRKGEIAKALASQLKSKFSPKLEFIRDTTEDKAFEIEQMINQLEDK